MSAEDKDSERYNSFEYKLQSTSATDLFRVDSKTGEITTRAALDREQRSLHRFNVVAYDRQAPTMSSSAVVSVQVSPSPYCYYILVLAIKLLNRLTYLLVVNSRSENLVL